MPTIKITTNIAAPQQVCFQLALSIDLHTISTQQTGEQIVGGVRSGILQLHDSVTFRARHFGIWQTLTSKITELNAPNYFCDVMQQGAFKRMRHEHYFEAKDSETIMLDVFTFESPFGYLGRLVDALVLKRYMRVFLQERCNVIKRYAEEEDLRKILPV